MAKMYEVTCGGLTVDFRTALCGWDSFKYHERYCNAFTQLVKTFKTLTKRGDVKDGSPQADVLATCRQELYARAYNYCRKGRGWDAHTACELANAFMKKLAA